MNAKKLSQNYFVHIKPHLKISDYTPGIKNEPELGLIKKINK